MINTQYINLNMIPSGVMPVLYCSQYDIGRPLGVVVYNGAESVDLSVYTCTIEATRTDKTPVTAAVTTSGNIGVFETTATMTNQADTYKGKLVLTDGNGKRVASLAFVFIVTVRTMDEDAEEIEEDASLYQQYTGTVQTIIASIRADLAAEVTARQNAITTEANARAAAVSTEAAARQSADNTLQSNINAEASTRATADTSLQSQIDQLIAPSGEAPSAAEVENARIGSDGTVYPTLGDAIRTQNSLLKNALENAGDVSAKTKNIISQNFVSFEKGAIDTSGNPSTNANRGRTRDFLQFDDGLVYISAPQTFGTGVYTYDSNGVFVSYAKTYKYGSFVLPVNANYQYKLLVRPSIEANYDTWKGDLAENYHVFNMVENDSVYNTVPSSIRIGALDSSGNPSTNDKCASDTEYIPVSDPLMIYVESGFQCEIAFYDAGKTYIGYSGWYSTGINEVMLPANAAYFKRIIKNTDTSIDEDASYNYGARQVIRSNEAEFASDTIGKYSDIAAYGSKVSAEKDNIVLLPFTQLTFEENGFDSQGLPSINSARGRSGFVKFNSPYIYINIPDGIGLSMLEYDSNKVFIEGDSDYSYGDSFAVVDTSHYYRFHARNSANEQFSTWADAANKTCVFNIIQTDGLYKTVPSYVEKNSLSDAGLPSSNANRGRDRNFVSIPSNPLLIRINSGYDCAVFYYDESQNFISGVTYTGKTGIISYDPPSNAVYLKRMVKNSGNTGYSLGFICGTEILEPTDVTAYIDTHASDEGAYLPLYEVNEVNRVSAELETTMKPLSLEFAFVTDPHTDTTADSNDMKGLNHIVNSIKRLNRIAEMDTVIGGDLIENITGTTAKQQFLKSCYAFNQAVASLKRTVLKGNHDDNSIAGRTSSTAQTVLPGKEISDEEMFIKWWKPIVNSGIILDEQNPTGMYGYRDYYSQKIRMIFLNTNDVPYMIDPETGYIKYPSQWVFGYQNRQLNWLCDALKVDDGWAVVICQHDPVELGGENAVINGDIFVGIINAFKNGTHYTATGSTADFECSVDVDFSTQGAREFICCVCGHVHLDQSYTSSGFLTIVTQNALPRGATTSVMIPGTVTENAYDVFSIDRSNRRISVIRFGYGGAEANRTFSY